MTKIKDLNGKRFGKLLVLSFVDIYKHKARWLCKCDCGKEIVSIGVYLTIGDTQSCGCLLKEKERENGNKSGKNNLAKYIESKRKPPGESSRNHLFYLYKYKASHRNISFELSIGEFSTLTKGNCFYCGIKPFQIKLQKGVNPYVYNGIDRKDSAKGYSVDNCVSCCGTCNTAKMDMSFDKFSAWIKSAYLNMTNKSALTVSMHGIL